MISLDAPPHESATALRNLGLPLNLMTFGNPTLRRSHAVGLWTKYCARECQTSSRLFRTCGMITGILRLLEGKLLSPAENELALLCLLYIDYFISAFIVKPHYQLQGSYSTSPAPRCEFCLASETGVSFRSNKLRPADDTSWVGVISSMDHRSRQS